MTAQCEIVMRKWGNSLGATFPKELLEKENIHEDDRLRVIVVKEENPLKSLFGIGKGRIKQSAQEIKDELRRELYNDDE